MKFDFDKIVDRKHTNSLKWDVKDGELPLWVADMDFETAPCVKNALEKRVSNGIFGYSIVPEELKNSYINWWNHQHGLEILPECIIFCTGVVPAISVTILRSVPQSQFITEDFPAFGRPSRTVRMPSRMILPF